MDRIYEAVLVGDRLEWKNGGPEVSGPVDVQVRLTGCDEQIDAAERRRRMADALESIAAQGGIASIPDPVAWQREVRTDKPLAGREERSSSTATS
jgi:hypothetical protein